MVTHCQEFSNEVRISLSSSDNCIDLIKGDECSVCLEVFPADEYQQPINHTYLPCSHKFHISCLLSWLLRRKNDPTCPMCRAEVPKEFIRDLQYEIQKVPRGIGKQDKVARALGFFSNALATRQPQALLFCRHLASFALCTSRIFLGALIILACREIVNH